MKSAIALICYDNHRKVDNTAFFKWLAKCRVTLDEHREEYDLKLKCSPSPFLCLKMILNGAMTLLLTLIFCFKEKLHKHYFSDLYYLVNNFISVIDQQTYSKIVEFH